MEKSERFQPKIYHDKASGRYDFDLEWIQKKLIYKCDAEENWQEDVLVGFGCPHAGSVHTDYDFFINQLPKVILEIKAKVLAGDGDLIEGLKYHLVEKKEVYGGLDYTDQEELIAHMVAEVMMRVFDVRFQEAWEALGKKELSEEELEIIILDALLAFIYREGNHDEWVQDFGIVPLTTFRHELVKRLTRAITDVLKEKGYYLPNLSEIVENKVIKPKDYIYTLLSGINLEMLHLHMARAKTTTLRLQEALIKSDCQVVLLANFHVATSMERWGPEFGQRVGMQLGAIMTKTKFEEDKGKKLDTGIGCLRIFSKDEKIMMSEEFYVSPPTKEGLDNKDILKSLEKKIGIR